MTLLCTYITGYGTEFVYPELPREVVRNLAVEALPSGLIAFELRDGAIAYWLNLILHHTFIRASSVSLPSIPALSSRLFAIQHSHARCCSLLRLAHREQLIILNQPDAEPNQWRFISPATISWLDASSQLHLKSSSERDLVSWLLRALDAIVEPSPLRAKQILLLAEEGSRLFQVLHQTHPLFGDFRTQPRDRIHAHLALVLATQRMLSQLLHQLSASAPKEL
ncbi:MAG: hypothetical protein IGS48_02895 [Oscillatoriales cyanobacterium C42_A2020_001]|nr:hypothetical protein [Leptolyngbyaceae cyanobacterium C42_A2020_001]